MIGRRRYILLLRFQKIIGKLRHAALGIPSGKNLFTPLHDALRTGSDKIIITKLLRHTFRLLRLATNDPIHVKQLVVKKTYLLVNVMSAVTVWVECGYRSLV